MRNNSQPLTPSGLFSARMRLNSINSPFISPMNIVQSPCLNDGNFVDVGQANNELNHFLLQAQNGTELEKQEVNEKGGQEDQQSSLKFPSPPENIHDKDLLLDENNMLEFVLTHANRNNQILDEAREMLEGYGTQFNRRLYDYLANKFKKLKKTKEEMVKYCIRKSFKHITNKMRAANKQAYSNLENNQVVAEYFEIHCQGDTSISMPFKKNSEERTMNSNFLKKIFKCRQYNIDYRDFMKHFPEQFTADNNKKIKSMNQAIRKCARNRCFKSLDEYKRLPWTVNLLSKIFEFAKQLMDHSPYRKQNLDDKKCINNGQNMQYHQNINGNQGQKLETNELLDHDEFEIIRQAPKKSIIILTPPMRPKSEPTNNLPDVDLLE